MFCGKAASDSGFIIGVLALCGSESFTEEDRCHVRPGKCSSIGRAKCSIPRRCVKVAAKLIRGVVQVYSRAVVDIDRQKGEAGRRIMMRLEANILFISVRTTEMAVELPYYAVRNIIHRKDS